VLYLNMNSAKVQAKILLDKAGITINGPDDFDVHVFNEKVYERVLRHGSLAIGESYMDGWWDAKRLDEFLYKALSADLGKQFEFSFEVILTLLQFSFFNLQSRAKVYVVGQRHYDIGNDLYEKMLGKTMAYSCGYWSSPTKPAKTLDDAQNAKLDLICKKLNLKRGQHILDIGCGWGSFLKFAAKNYGVKGMGVTISKEQEAYAKKWCKGLPIEILMQDYRTLTGSFDHIVSVGMFEHVGVKNYHVYFKKAHELLKADGLFLLHTIGSNNSAIPLDLWIEKYIFPNGMLPSVAQIGKSVEGLFVMEDWHNFGADYDKTLMAWFKNFEKAWPKLEPKYGDPPLPGASARQGRFYRMWKYYLLSCAATFRVRNTQLWQVVLSKKGVPGGYKSIR